jgi:hypothetical protein
MDNSLLKTHSEGEAKVIALTNKKCGIKPSPSLLEVKQVISQSTLLR